MAMKDRYIPRPVCDRETEPFESVEQAWFWFIQAQQARNDGARIGAGLGLVARPCEPADILKILDRLYRNRRLQMDHLLVLRHYGRRQMPPDPRRTRRAAPTACGPRRCKDSKPRWSARALSARPSFTTSSRFRRPQNDAGF